MHKGLDEALHMPKALVRIVVKTLNILKALH